MEYDELVDINELTTATSEDAAREMDAEAKRELRKLTESYTKSMSGDSMSVMEAYRKIAGADMLVDKIGSASAALAIESPKWKDLTANIYSDSTRSAIDSISDVIAKHPDFLDKALGKETWDVSKFGSLGGADLARSLVAADSLKFNEITRADAHMDMIRDLTSSPKMTSAIDSILNACVSTKDFGRLLGLYDMASPVWATAETWKFASAAGDIIGKFQIADLAVSNLTAPWRADLLNDVKGLASSMVSIEALGPKIDPTMFSVTKYLPVEVYSASSALYHVDHDEDEETIPLDEELRSLVHSEIEVSLGRVDPKLAKLWLGACSARQRKDHDYVRHTFISLRELVTHILHQLAPDAAIRAWTNDPKYFDNGRPTREARIEYISRSVQPELSGFIKQDVKAMIALINTLNGGTHEIERNLSDAGLEAICVRVECVVRFLITVAMPSNN